MSAVISALTNMPWGRIVAPVMNTKQHTLAETIAHALNLSHAEIARKVGLSKSQVGNILRGKNTPSVTVACRIASLLNVPVERIWPPWAA